MEFSICYALLGLLAYFCIEHQDYTAAACCICLQEHEHEVHDHIGSVGITKISRPIRNDTPTYTQLHLRTCICTLQYILLLQPKYIYIHKFTYIHAVMHYWAWPKRIGPTMHIIYIYYIGYIQAIYIFKNIYVIKSRQCLMCRFKLYHNSESLQIDYTCMPIERLWQKQN